jgi:hypothetical protein
MLLAGTGSMAPAAAGLAGVGATLRFQRDVSGT